MIRTIALSAFVALFAAPALAVTQAEILSAEVLPGWQTDSGTQMAALRLTLAPDWKTYWRSPGEAGIPPLFDWSDSRNVASVRLHWPRPQVFTLNGMQTIGYKHELVLPIEVTPIDAGRPILLRADIELGVCRDICMPAALTLSADLDGPGAPDAAIRKALKDRPESPTEAGLADIGCTVEPISDGLRLTATLRMPATGGEETVVFEPHGGAIWVSQSDVRRTGGELVAKADLVPDSGGPFALDRSGITVTVLGRDRAVEIRGCPAP